MGQQLSSAVLRFAALALVCATPLVSSGCLLDERPPPTPLTLRITVAAQAVASRCTFVPRDEEDASLEGGAMEQTSSRVRA